MKGEHCRQATDDEVSQPSKILIDGVSVVVRRQKKLPPAWLHMPDESELRIVALREKYGWLRSKEEATVPSQKPMQDKGKSKAERLTLEDIPYLRQQWQEEFVDILNGIKEELPPW